MRRDNLTAPCIGLKANAELGKWDAAADFADMLFRGVDVLADCGGADKYNDTRSLAIQEYGNAERNIEATIELLYDSLLNITWF